jgi:hypothetical protein
MNGTLKIDTEKKWRKRISYTVLNNRTGKQQMSKQHSGWPLIAAEIGLHKDII